MKSFYILVASMFLSLSLAQASLSVSPQELMGHTVSIDNANLEQDGFIVVHAFDTNGELVLTPPLGVVYLAAGMYSDIAIELDAMLLEENAYGAESKNVLPMIHVDANANQVYEFPEGGDVPVMVNDAMVIAELPVTYNGMMSMMDETQMVPDFPFSISLSGAQEVPAVTTNATGSALVRIDGNQFAISGRFENLSSPVFPIAGTPAHIHMGAFGENGAPVILLSVSSNQDGLRGVFSAEAELTDEQLAAFKAGHFYLNIHSEMHQGGELRGQLVHSSALPELMSMMEVTPSLITSPQAGSNISIDSVSLAEDGFVVIHAFDTAGELVLTPPLGVTYLSAGTHSNVVVELNATLLEENGYSAGAKDVLPMIHVDANANQVYEFPEGGDVPVMVNGEMVVATLALTY